MNKIEKIKEILIILFVSYESLAFWGFILLYLLFPNFFLLIGNEIMCNNIFAYLMPAEVGLMVFCYTFIIKLLKPQERNKVLYLWGDYWKLKYRAHISFLITFFSLAIIVILWVFHKYLPNNIIGLFSTIFIIVPLITDFSVFINSFKLNEILETEAQ